jgi:hypothetical protein
VFWDFNSSQRQGIKGIKGIKEKLCGIKNNYLTILQKES